jgi:hypothetical protein
MKSAQSQEIGKPGFGRDAAARGSAVFEHSHQDRPNLIRRPRSGISAPQALQNYGMQIAGSLEVLHIEVRNINAESFFEDHHHFEDIEGHPD